MRPPRTLLATLLILLAACGTTSPSEPTPARGTAATPARPAEKGLPPADVSNVKGNRVRVEWRDLNPSHPPQRLGLINSTSPEHAEIYRDPQKWQGVKPVDDQMMANILSAFEESDFQRLAEKGKDVGSYSMGDGNGVVSLTVGDQSWALFFPRMTDPDEARSSPIPKTYRDLKVLIIQVYNQTLFLAPTSPQDPNRVFQTPSIDRRR